MSQYNVADLEISLRHQSEDRYLANMRFCFPKKKIDVQLAGDAIVEIDFKRLTENAQDLEKYGQLLTDMFFADSQMRDGWKEIQRHIAPLNTKLNLKLDLPTTTDKIHKLRWEALRDPVKRTTLATSERTLFSRYIGDSAIIPLCRLSKTDLRALAACRRVA